MGSFAIFWTFCLLLELTFGQNFHLSSSFHNELISKGQLGVIISPCVVKSSTNQGLKTQPSAHRLSAPKPKKHFSEMTIREKNHNMETDNGDTDLIMFPVTALPRILSSVRNHHMTDYITNSMFNRRRLFSIKTNQLINRNNSSNNISQMKSSADDFSTFSNQNNTLLNDSLINFTGSDAITRTTTETATTISNKTTNKTSNQITNEQKDSYHTTLTATVIKRSVRANINTTQNNIDNDTNEIINETDDNNNLTFSFTASNSMQKFMIEYIAFPVFAVTCIVGNAINIFVMLSSSLRKAPSTYILVALAVSDSTFILMWPFNKNFVRQLFLTDVRSLSDASCKIFFFVFKTVKMSSAGFVTLVSIERFIAIWFPLKAKIINTKKIILIQIASVVIFLSIINGAWSVSSKIINGVCVPHADVEGYPNMKQNFVIYGIVFVFILPTAIMLILSPLTAFQLYRQYRSRIRMTNNVSDSKVNNSASDTIRATVMLLSVTLAFVLLMTPITFSHIYMVLIGQNIFETSDNRLVIYRNVSQVLELSNFTINFFLYVLISKSYRDYLLGCCRKKKKIKITIKTQRTIKEN